MRWITKAICYLSTVVLPAVTFGAALPVAKSGSSASEQNLSEKAEGLLNRIHADAYHAAYNADRLNSFEFLSSPDMLAWETHSYVLSREAYWTNNMDRLLTQLRTMQHELPANQRAEVKTLTPALLELTDSTQAAILFVNQHEDELFLQQYRDDVKAIDNEATRVEAVSANHHLASNHARNHMDRTASEQGS